MEILLPPPFAVQLGPSVTLSQPPQDSLLVWSAGSPPPLWATCLTPLGLLPSAPAHSSGCVQSQILAPDYPGLLPLTPVPIYDGKEVQDMTISVL